MENQDWHIVEVNGRGRRARDVVHLSICRRGGSPMDKWMVQAKSGESEKFRQLLFSPLYNHFQLQLERFGELFLDLFDALNPPVPSICPCDCRLLRYRQNRARVKNSASSCFPHCTTTFNYNQNALESCLWTYLMR